MPFSKALVGLAIAAPLVVAACTRFNPSFGGDTTETGKTTDPDDDDDDATASADEHDTAKATTTTTTSVGDETPASSDGTTSGAVETTQTQGTTSGSGCVQIEPALFDVSAADANGDSIPAACGTTFSWQGSMTTTIVPHELVVADCGGSCDCVEEPATVHLSFTELDPSPADLLVDGDIECFSVTVSRRSRVDGCTVEWILVESLASSADYPSFIATSTDEPSWGLAVPPAVLGDVLQPCEGALCDFDPQPGEYQLFLGGNGPIAPGASLVVDLNPYASVAATYGVHALFAQVDETCVPRLGWSAIVLP